MFKKTIIGASVIVAAAGAALLLKAIKDRNNNEDVEEKEEKEGNEVHFIKIDDEDEVEEAPKKDASNKSSEVQEVCEVYPYLDPEFVEELLNQNASLNEMYENDSLIQIVHHVSFDSHENLESFLDIMETAGYECDVVSEHEVTATKKMFVEEGSIISEILNVANQTVALSGKYESQEIQK